MKQYSILRKKRKKSKYNSNSLIKLLKYIIQKTVLIN